MLRIFKRSRDNLTRKTLLWLVALFLVVLTMMLLIQTERARATTGGTMKLYFHEEVNETNTTYNAATLTPPEPTALTASATSTTTFVSAPCEASTNTAENLNQINLDAGTTGGDRCVATFISQQVGQSLTISTTDTNALSVTWWDAAPGLQNGFTYTGNFRFYRLSGTTYTLFATLTSASITAAIAAASHTVTGTPTVATTFASTDRIAIVESMNVTADGNSGVTLNAIYDHVTDVSFATLSYTMITPSKPTLAGAADDDFTTTAATTSCTNAGVTYHTIWTCTTPTGTALGNFNAASEDSEWLWLENIQGATLGTNFNTSPSNTYLYETVPAGDGDIITVVNSSATFTVGASSAVTPFFHSGLLYWTSNTDYIIVEVLQSAAGTRGVAVNNSGTVGATTALAANFNEVWLKITKTGTSFQPYYSTDGATFTALGSAISHATAFTRMGLNAYAALINTHYAGAFEYFKSTLTTGAVTPTTDQLIRHGNWWNAGVEQNFFWAK